MPESKAPRAAGLTPAVPHDPCPFEASAASSVPFQFASCALIVWLAGATTLLITALLRGRACLREVRAAARIERPDLEILVGELSRQLKITRRVRLVVTASRVGPAVVGLFRPTILLPAAVVAGKDAEALRPILAHELLHVRRGDLCVGALQIATQALWWFHPLVWLANRLATRAAEACCDEETIAELGCRADEYAQSLLDVLELKRRLIAVPAFPGLRPVDVTRERMERIMELGQGCRRRTPWWCWIVLLVAAMAVLPGGRLVVSGEVGGSDSSEKQDASGSPPASGTEPANQPASATGNGKPADRMWQWDARIDEIGEPVSSTGAAIVGGSIESDEPGHITVEIVPRLVSGGEEVLRDAVFRARAENVTERNEPGNPDFQRVELHGKVALFAPGLQAVCNEMTIHLKRVLPADTPDARGGITGMFKIELAGNVRFKATYANAEFLRAWGGRLSCFFNSVGCAPEQSTNWNSLNLSGGNIYAADWMMHAGQIAIERAPGLLRDAMVDENANVPVRFMLSQNAEISRLKEHDSKTVLRAERIEWNTASDAIRIDRASLKAGQRFVTIDGNGAPNAYDLVELPAEDAPKETPSKPQTVLSSVMLDEALKAGHEPEFDELLQSLGELLVQKRLDEADAVVERARKLSPKSRLVQLMRLKVEGARQEAASSKAKQASTNPPAQTNESNAEETSPTGSGKTKDNTRKQEIRRLVDLFNDLVSQGRLDEAEAVVEKAREIAPKHPVVVVLSVKSRLARQEAANRRAKESSPGESEGKNSDAAGESASQSRGPKDADRNSPRESIGVGVKSDSTLTGVITLDETEPRQNATATDGKDDTAAKDELARKRARSERLDRDLAHFEHHLRRKEFDAADVMLEYASRDSPGDPRLDEMQARLKTARQQVADASAAKSAADNAEKRHPNWHTDFIAARALATKEKRPLLAYFRAPWCGPCTVLERELFDKAEATAQLTARFVLARIDLDNKANRSLQAEFQIVALPTIVVIAPDGAAIFRTSGYSQKNREKLLASLLNVPPEGANSTDAAADKVLRDARKLTAATISRSDTGRAAELKIEGALAEKVSLHFENAPLSEVIQHLAAQRKINIVIDRSGLEDAGLRPNAPVSIDVEDISLESALKLLLDPFQLKHMYRDEVLLITSKIKAKGDLVTITYPVADLVATRRAERVGLVIQHGDKVEHSVSLPFERNRKVATVIKRIRGLTPASRAEMWVMRRNNDGTFFGRIFRVDGAGTNDPSPKLEFELQPGDSVFVRTDTPNTLGVDVPADSEDYNFEALIGLIKNTVEPETWIETDGQGAIQQYNTTVSLVVRQTQDVHDKIGDLLKVFRRVIQAHGKLRVALFRLPPERSLKSLDLPSDPLDADDRAAHLKDAEATALREALRKHADVTFITGLDAPIVNRKGGEWNFPQLASAEGRVAPALHLLPIVADDRQSISFRMDFGARTPLEAFAAMRTYDVRSGESLLLDVTDEMAAYEMADRGFTDSPVIRRMFDSRPRVRTFVLLSPEIAEVEEEEELLGVTR